MKNDMEMIDVSDSSKGKDKFIKILYRGVICRLINGLK